MRKTKEEKDTELLEIVKQRLKIAEDYQLPLFNKFVDFYQYYRAINSLGKDEGVWQANIKVPYIKQVVDTIMPRLVSSKPKVNVLPREEGDINNAQQNEKLVNYQWEKMRMYKKIKMWVKQALIYGVGLMKIGWDFDDSNEKDGLWCELVSPYDFYIDPNSTDIEDGWVIFKQDRDFETVRRNKNYKNTDKLAYALGIKDNAQKISQRASLNLSEAKKDNRKKVTIYEYYGMIDLGKGIEEAALVVTANNNIVLRAAKLAEIYPCGIPFVALQDDPMPLEFWSIGEVEPLITLQDELNTIRNQRVDNRNININTMWLVNKNGGVNWDDFVTRPGGVIECDDVNAVKPLPVQDMTGGSVQEESIVKQDMDRTSGIFPGMMGQLDRTVGGEGAMTSTARGFLASIEQAGTKLQYKLDNLDDALQELGQKMLKMNAKYITKEQTIRILGKAGVQFEKISKESIQKEYDLRVEGGSTQPQNREAKNQQYLQMLQTIMPFIQTPMYDYEPGQIPVQTQLNAKYFIDNLLNNADLPNREEAFISQQELAPPPEMINQQGYMYEQTQPKHSISTGGTLPSI
jgi:hypothetical protein